ncbi:MULTISPECIES: FtsW/RodA/SpoVE family cell cycle protein [Enterococcus]|uniref:Rod shape determining protein RodA n=1 Tax=Enterococcus sulfureus ATCC 49903 TaxID=1140003 RepID=S0LAZ4_9ENTE|nr:FtsW/RodA/SpoVE family cell cycle protein [Enterococcus sulfureus]EOT48721.1 rod shape determining protein RodA [Enterococcus sulfureus ATCC 49903]EOT87613.1 rod shape determining protein RodA [Enterococcus sulfureus ATCC 49903]
MENNRRTTKRIDSRIDYGVILPVFLLCLIGLGALYVAYAQNPLYKGSLFAGVAKQALWYVLGIIAVIIIMQIKSKWLWKLTPYIYGGGLVIMLALLEFYDRGLAESTGSRNWFHLGAFTLQPAELMKIAYILMMARIVTSHNSKYRQRNLASDGILIGKMFAITLPVLLLVLLQKDFGTMLVFLAIFGGIFLMSGITWKIVVPLIATFLVLSSLILFLVISDTGREFLANFGFKAYQFKRIDSWLDPFHDIQGSSRQVATSIMAIGSGGLLGKGFNVSDIYVSVRESDMIFSVIGENFGFIGSALVVFLYFVLIYRMIRVCYDTNNEFYAYISAGIIMMILFHVFENIGANIGLLPLTGIPLPFISQGGSALLSNMIGIGLILSMRFQASK